MFDAVAAHLRSAFQCIPEPARRLARTHAIVTSFGAALWGLGVGLVPLLANRYPWAASADAPTLLAQGVSLIVIASAGIFVMTLAAGTAHASDVVTETRREADDMIEIRAVSFVVDGVGGHQAWEDLREGTHSDANTCISGASDGVHLNDWGQRVKPLAALISNVAEVLPTGWPMPTLMWPGAAGDFNSSDLALAAKSLGRSGTAFALKSLPEELGSPDLMAKAFALFDADPMMPAVLIVASDGEGFRDDASKDVVPNAAVVLFAKPDRLAAALGAEIIASAPVLGRLYRPAYEVANQGLKFQARSILSRTWLKASSRMEDTDRPQAAIFYDGASLGIRSVVYDLLNRDSRDDEAPERRVFDILKASKPLGRSGPLTALAFAIIAANAGYGPVAFVSTRHEMIGTGMLLGVEVS